MTAPTVITLGCRLNAFESEVMRGHAEAAGLEDCVIVNTCAVTGEAVRHAARSIRKLRRERPEARIVVTGCAAQIEPGRFAAIDEADHVIGNAEKMRFETFAALTKPGSPRVQVGDIMGVREAASHRLEGFPSHTRAIVQVQNGCDHRCTFCVIPFGRGPSRSVPAGDVVAQIRVLVEKGTAEAVLTGVDITAYGGDLPGAPTLGSLVLQVLRDVPELNRLRLSSIDSVEADALLLEAIATEPRLMPHLHLSLQSGDDMILKRMKRRHLRGDAIAFCKSVRRVRPDVAFGADLIAGFPTESEAMFQRSLDLVDECGLTYLHVFPFSARKGTPAERMPQVPGAEIKERAGRLRRKGEHVLARYLDAQAGARVEVVMEMNRMGRTPQFAEIVVANGPERGTVARVLVTGHDGRRLAGEAAA